MTPKPFGIALGEGGVVDGYVVENVVADRGHAERICDAVGPDAEPVTLAVAWRAPADRHAWPRFRRLARTRAALEHEALVPVRAVGAYSGRPYLAMDRYPEATFEELIASAPLPACEVLGLLAPVCDALDLAHANGLVHQSLSDTSLLMEGDSLLLDGFGLAGGRRELSFESVGVHEVRYCPPEELRGEPLEPASNLYSLTALLVHALTGNTPYRGAPAAHAYGHLVEPPPRPSADMPQLGSGFDEVVARGMAKDPAQRPGSAGELLREAAAALGVELPQPHASTDRQQRGRRHRPAAVRIRRVRTSAVAATVIVAAAAGIAAGVVLDPFDGSQASAAGRSVDVRALARLDDQRTPLRARLATEETPQEQAATAAELADAYGRAADAAESARLVSAARTAERAYEELGAAADAGSAERFAAASDQVARADARLGSIAAASR
jgi:serine/threonine-protein kinase